ncbi:hypothetical protein GF337_19865 [candidate division KSB1 bacterium]|nr:hypothetical protein [candidate division KSB1 bacterium]
MLKNVGLWVDHEKAYVVSLINGTAQMSKMESDVESHIKTLGGSRSKTPYAPQDISAERKFEGRRKKHLRMYYKQLIKNVKDAKQIYIFGPGEARTELEKEMKKSKPLSKKITANECCDRMTERQIIAKVKKFYQ